MLSVIFAGDITCAGASPRAWAGWGWQLRAQYMCSSSQAFSQSAWCFACYLHPLGISLGSGAAFSHSQECS